jgi:hypothetical protein
MVALIKIAVQLLADAAGFAVLLFRPNQSVQAENLFLRRQFASNPEDLGRALRPWKATQQFGSWRAGSAEHNSGDRKTIELSPSAGGGRCCTLDVGSGRVASRVFLGASWNLIGC